VTDFRARTDAFLAEFLALQPTAATLIGEHAYDARWPDMSAAGRRERIAFADRWLAEFRGFTELPADDAIDRDLLVQQLDAMRFADLDLRQEAWSPLEWVYLLGGGLFGLVSREFAPLAERLASVAGRLDGFEAMVDAAIEEIGPVGDRPVARFHTEKALEQLPGVIELADEALTMAEEAQADDPAVAAVLPRLRASTERARGEMERFERHLREKVLPQSEGEGRLGARLFAEKMRHTMRSQTLTPERIKAGAEREYVAVRAEMVRLARQLWPTWCDGQPIPGDEGMLVRGVLDAIALEHPKADDRSISAAPRTPGSRPSAPRPT